MGRLDRERLVLRTRTAVPQLKLPQDRHVELAVGQGEARAGWIDFVDHRLVWRLRLSQCDDVCRNLHIGSPP
jgi:hypothetical protein